MSMTLLQTATATPSTAQAITATFANPTRPGSLILAFVGATGITDTNGAPTDNAGNIYTQAYGAGSSNCTTSLWYTNKWTVASTAVTTNFIGTTDTHSLIIREYSQGSFPSLDRNPSQNAGSGASVTSAASSTTRAVNELVVCSAVLAGTSPTLTLGSGFGNLATDTFGGTAKIHGIEDQLVTTAGAQTGTFTGGGTPGAWDCSVATFFEESGQILGRNVQVGGGMSRNEKAY